MLWGKGAAEMPFNAAFALLNWYPLLTLPLFIYMGYMFSESGIASDLYRMFHVWMGSTSGGLAIGTMGLMVAVSAMNGLSVAGMAIGASLALPEMLKRKYDKVMVTGVIQAGSSLGIMVPPSVVLVLYGMIARQPVGQLWMAGVFPGLLLAALFIIYIYIRCRLQPHLGPTLSKEELAEISWGEKLRLLRAGIVPLVIIFSMTGLFLMGITSLVQCSAAGATVTTLAALVKGRLTRRVMEETLKNTLSVSCMFMWVILAALCFGAVFDGLGAVHAIKSLFIERWGLSPFGNPGDDAVVLHSDGHVSGRHGHADHRCTAVCSPGNRAGLQPDLVWCSLHDHLSDSLYDAALWLQPVSDEGHGTQGGVSGGYISFDRAVCSGHAGGSGHRDDVSRDCPVVAQLLLWTIRPRPMTRRGRKAAKQILYPDPVEGGQ